MSEFTNNKENRLIKLMELAHILLKKGNARSFIIENESFIQKIVPSDFITLFDDLIKEGHPMKEMKALTNKVLNIFYIPIQNFKRTEPEKGTFLGVLEQNNREMVLILNKIRPVFKAFVKDISNKALSTELIGLFNKLEVFTKHYTVKENVLFPVIEKTWLDYRCLQIMWSFHDDIRANIKTVIDQLTKNEIELKKLNRCVGDIFFNMLAIKFREEKILFPFILSTISENQLERMNREGFDIGYPYIKPSKPILTENSTNLKNGMADLGTGTLSMEQIKFIFNNLPVDITYVDENDKVCYFSTPKKRIFPRTTAIIGREVVNCHPYESVHVVERIIKSFRNGKKDIAEFWIKTKGEFILIQYFAVRDEQGNYKGVIEVSQEISGIKTLEGEKKLLDW